MNQSGEEGEYVQTESEAGAEGEEGIGRVPAWVGIKGARAGSERAGLQDFRSLPGGLEGVVKKGLPETGDETEPGQAREMARNAGGEGVVTEAQLSLDRRQGGQAGREEHAEFGKARQHPREEIRAADQSGQEEDDLHDDDDLEEHGNPVQQRLCHDFVSPRKSQDGSTTRAREQQINQDQGGYEENRDLKQGAQKCHPGPGQEQAKPAELTEKREQLIRRTRRKQPHHGKEKG